MFSDWLNNIIDKGFLCNEYSNKVSSALSKKQLVDIGLDANGIHYLCEMRQNGYPLDYNVLLNEFKHFINGKYIFTSKPNAAGVSYTCELYCRYNNRELNVRTTCVSLLDCATTICIKPYDCVSVHLDENCDVKIKCHDTSSCRVYLYGAAKVDIIEGINVKLINVDRK